MSTGLRKPQPQKRRIQRVSGEQDITVGSAPKFSQITCPKIKNVESISSHTYIKEASEGQGLAIWKMADNKYALAIDKIFLRDGGNLQTIASEQLASSKNYVNIKQNQILVSRESNDGEGAAIAIEVPGTNSNGISIATVPGSTGDGIIINMGGTGNAIDAESSGGNAGYFTGQVTVVGNIFATNLQMPKFYAYDNTGNRDIANTTATQIVYDTEVFDTHEDFASNVFTPSVAGYYRLNATLMMDPDGIIDGSWQILTIQKNGSAYKKKVITYGGTGKNFENLAVEALVYANGTTDYFDVVTYIDFDSAGDTYSNDPENYTTFFGHGVQ